MNIDKTLNVINYITCSILSISIFLVFIPIIDELFRLGILCVQVFVIFYLHNALNSEKSYYIFTSLLGISNFIVCVFSCIVTIKSIDNIGNTQEASDIFSSVTLQISIYMMQYIFAFIFIVTAIVVIECIISMIIKQKCFKKTNASAHNTAIESSETACSKI